MTNKASALEPLSSCVVRIAAAVGTRNASALEEPFDVAVRLTEEQGQQVAEAVDEVLLQSILFVGYPVALEALAAWRKRMPGSPAPTDAGPEGWEARGERVCRAVYGDQYPQLRSNIRALHPDAEKWMISDGYGRVLGRPGLDLITRELAVVAQLAVLGAPRQLFSHALGALRVGASTQAVADTLTIAMQWIRADAHEAVHRVWSEVQAKASVIDFSHTTHPS